MKLKFVCVVALVLSSAGCAKMQEIERVAPAQAQAAGGMGKSKTFIYEKAVVKSAAGSSAVTIQVGIACVPRAEGVTNEDNYSETSLILENVFKEELERAGYSTLGTVSSGDLFTEKRDVAADYRVAAVVTKPKMNVCAPLIGFGNSDGHGEASLTVTWQIYSDAQKSVVYSSEQKGYAKISSSVPRPVRALWREAFANAVRGLLADPGFVALVNSPSATPAAPTGRSRTN